MSSPEEVLNGYLTEIQAWERQCAQSHKKVLDGETTTREMNRVAMEEHRKIFIKYCSKKAKAIESADFSHDPVRPTIVKTEIKAKLAEILTRVEVGKNMKSEFLFRLRLEGNEWKICERFFLLDKERMKVPL